MKKLLIPVLFLAFFACKKEESSSQNDVAIPFSKDAIIGKWNINKFESLNVANDSILIQMTFNTGDAHITFNANGTYITKTTFDESEGTFNVLKLNGKDVLVTIETGDRPDSMEILSFTKSAMVFDDKQFEQRRGSNDYTKAYCSK